MKNFKKEFEFILNEEIEYQVEGDIKKTNKLLLKAPANINRRETYKLRQDLLKGMREAADFGNEQNQDQNQKLNKSSQDDLDASTVLAGLFMSSIDMTEYIETFEQLLLEECCFVDGKVKLTELLLKKISTDDLELLLGEYVANFILPSWMKAQMKTIQ